MTAGDADEGLMDAGHVDIEGPRIVESGSHPVRVHDRDETEHLGSVYRAGTGGRCLVIEQVRTGSVRHPEEPTWGQKRGVGSAKRRVVEERLAGNAQRP
jgi:hypothetical protein